MNLSARALACLACAALASRICAEPPAFDKEQPPKFFSAIEFAQINAIGTIPDTEILRTVRAATQRARSLASTNRIAAYLVAENLNAPSEAISRILAAELPAIPYSGYSIHWEDKLPFPQESLLNVAAHSRGFEILLISTPGEAWIDSLPTNLVTFPTNSRTHEDHKRLQGQIAPDAARLLNKLSRNFPTDLIIYPVLKQWITSHEYFTEAWTKSGVHLVHSGDYLKAHLVRPYLNEKPLSDSVVYLCFRAPWPTRQDRPFLSAFRPKIRLDHGAIRPLVDFPSLDGNPLETITRAVGLDGVRIMRGAEKVETFLLDPIAPYRNQANGRETIEDYVIRSTGSIRDNAFAKRIASAVLNEDNYFGLAKRCIFRPGVALRFTAGADSSVMLICFGCEDIEIITRDRAQEKTASFDFSPNLAAVTQLVQELFPNDPEIQKLGRKEPERDPNANASNGFE